MKRGFPNHSVLGLLSKKQNKITISWSVWSWSLDEDVSVIGQAIKYFCSEVIKTSENIEFPSG